MYIIRFSILAVYIGKQPSIAKSSKNTRIAKQTVCCIFCRIL